jgi:hypothetical protein
MMQGAFAIHAIPPAAPLPLSLSLSLSRWDSENISEYRIRTYVLGCVSLRPLLLGVQFGALDLLISVNPNLSLGATS